jgi:hypothetical protein
MGGYATINQFHRGLYGNPIENGVTTQSPPPITLAKSWFCRPLYSLNPKKAPLGHKSFSFCEQTLHKGLIDASCNWLQSTRNKRGQNNFLRKLRAKIQFPRVLFSSLRFISSYTP